MRPKLNIEVPEEFWIEEIRNGFLVTEERKILWAIELDLLAELDRVCKKLDLNYWLGAGSLLGAIRHHGFIPWDNDIDIYMLRDDYDCLMKKSKEFNAPYFLQNMFTEKYHFKPHAKLRNSDTTGFSKFEKGFKINRGVFIDIFPLDGVCENKKKNELQRKKDYTYKKILVKCNELLNCQNLERISSRKGIVRLEMYLIMVISYVYKILYDGNLKRYSSNTMKMWGNRTLVFDCPKSRRTLDEWNKLENVPFEFITVPIPISYDGMLTQQYGNYMKLPQNLNGSRHGKIHFSGIIPYSEFGERRQML